MGLRCLLGHDFGDVEVEREREEDGNEMVVSIRELEICQRCGTERVVSENTEVTSIRTPEEVGLDAEAQGPESTPDASSAPSDATPTESVDADGPGAADADGTGDADGPSAPDTATSDAVGPGPADPTDPSTAAPPQEDDGVILPEEDEQRSHGEWPDAQQPSAERTGSDSTGSGDLVEGDDPTGATDPTEPTPDPDIESPASATESGTTGDDDLGADASEQSQESGAPDEQPNVPETESQDVEIIGSSADDGDESGGDVEGSSDGPDGTTATDSDDSPGDDTEPWPEHDGADEGFDARPGADEDVSFSGNSLTPDVTAEDPGPDAEYVGSSGGLDQSDASEPGGASEAPSRVDADTGIVREDPTSVEHTDADGNLEYYCPNCEMTRQSGASSMRAGDICPECHKGYVTERGA